MYREGIDQGYKALEMETGYKEMRKEDLSMATTLFMLFGVIALFTGITDVLLFLETNSELNVLGYELLVSYIKESAEIVNLIVFESFLLLTSSIILLMIGVFDIMTMQFMWKLKRITRITGLVGIFLALFYGVYRLAVSFFNPFGSDIEFSYSIFVIAFNLLILLSFSKVWKYLKR